MSIPSDANEIHETSVIANQKDLQQVTANPKKNNPNNDATILVVDDTLYNIQLLYLMLSKQGYKVVKASSGREALNTANEILPDLILLDIRMPIMDGYEVCTLLKQNERTNHIPVIFISSIDNPAEKVEAFSVGGVDYINKPFQLIEVLARVETHLHLSSLQKQLQFQNQQLQIAAQQLQHSLEKERELNQIKSNFISVVSHEFRTPLTSIQSSAELLEHYDWDRSEQVQQLRQIQGEVRHMTDLMEDVLFLSRHEAQKNTLNAVPFNLIGFCTKLLRQTKALLKEEHTILATFFDGTSLINHQITKQKIAIEQDALPNITVIMDENVLRHILMNLLSNAIKYSPLGGLIEFDCHVNNSEVIFVVKDQGIGIPKGEQDHLFSSFYRAKNVGTLPGTGLGLSIVKSCVDIHQGRISLQSDVGLGSTFEVILPINYNAVFSDSHVSE
ncbi:MAG: hybrid sensor histidine kinase/response regulator [Pseudanabaena sp. ELA607]